MTAAVTVAKEASDSSSDSSSSSSDSSSDSEVECVTPKRNGIAHRTSSDDANIESEIVQGPYEDSQERELAKVHFGREHCRRLAHAF